ncbi:MAG: gluconeogenesis factor YvcK family protein [Patescibacteria group bacterium]|jgi:uncharacterized cofD-like protein
MKNIVTIGGGNGQSMLLRELKKYNWHITSVVSMVDNGGSTGRLREEFGVLPSGDIRRCLSALATKNKPLQELMAYRFPQGDLKGHNLGNLLMLILEKELGGYEKMIEHLSKELKIKGRALPVTLQPTNLIAELNNGKKIFGETNIDVPKHNTDSKIKKVYLEKKVKANPKVLSAIKQADYIVYTIGDLYTSIIPNLLVAGVKEAIEKSKAQKIYTCNRTTKKGETHGFTVADYVFVLKQYLGKNSLDYIIVDKNIAKPPKGYELVKCIEPVEAEVIKADISSEEDRAHINAKKLAKAIWNLCQKP